MTVNIQIKALGRKIRQIGAKPYTFSRRPETLRQMIADLVSESVSAYNKRVRRNAPDSILSEETIEDMHAIGKIAFGVSYGGKEADPAQAIETAVRGFEDGLYRVFVNDREISELDVPLTLRKNDSIAIIRLVMLTGGFF